MSRNYIFAEKHPLLSSTPKGKEADKVQTEDGGTDGAGKITTERQLSEPLLTPTLSTSTSTVSMEFSQQRSTSSVDSYKGVNMEEMERNIKGLFATFNKIVTLLHIYFW